MTTRTKDAREAAVRARMRSAAWTVCVLLLGCGGGSRETVAETPAADPTPTPTMETAYEVHEWGLIRGGVDDSIELSATTPASLPMAVAKPVLYFHLAGDAPLDVQVVARMGAGGTLVETWPLAAERGAREAHWASRVTRGSCHHGRLPTLMEPACVGLPDGCEAATLDTVESDDADCVTVGAQAANHLFYRGSLRGVDPLPLVATRLPDGRVQVHNRGTEVIPGVLVRLHLANGVEGERDAARVVVAPPPGHELAIDVPDGATLEAAQRTAETLRALGLTEAETAAFRRAWDATLFHLEGLAAQTEPLPPGYPNAMHPVHASGATTTTVATAMPYVPPRATDSLVYFLPPSVVEQLATLELTPRPTAVRRAIAVWYGLPAQ